MKSRVQPTKPQRSYASASSPELYHKPCTLKMPVHGLITLFMEYIVGIQRCSYGWWVLFPVAIPKSEDAPSSPTLDLWELRDSIWPGNSSSWISQFHTDDTIPYTWYICTLHTDKVLLSCYHLLSGCNCKAGSAETRATLVGSLCQDRPNTQAKKWLWFTDHNLCMERSMGFKYPLLLLVDCEGQVGLWLLSAGV